MSAALDIRWHTAHIRVHTDLPAVRAYVANQHHLVADTAGGPVHDLTATVDPATLDSVRALIDPDAEIREAFTGERYALVRREDGYALVSASPAMYDHALLTRDFRSWLVVGAAEDSLGLVLTRTIREIVREDLLRRGAIMCHAGAARSADGHGALLIGTSGAGKTSAAIRIGMAPGGRAVGTDRTFLLRDGDRWLAVGLPMSTRLGAGAATAMGVPDRLVPIRAGIPQLAGQPRPDKVSLSNAEAHDLLGCGFVAATPVETIILLEPVPGTQPSTQDLDQAEATTRLAEHVLCPDPAYHSHWLAELADPQGPGETGEPKELAALIAAGLPVRQVTWDPALHCDEHTGDLLLRSQERTR